MAVIHKCTKWTLIKLSIIIVNVKHIAKKPEWSFGLSLIGLIVSIISLVIAIPSYQISVESLNLSKVSFDIASNQLKLVQNQLDYLNSTLQSFDRNIIFLKTEKCERVWYSNTPSNNDSMAACYNGTAWDICVRSFEGSSGCKNKDWFQEVMNSYSWQNTKNTWK